MIDFENRRAIIVEGYDVIMTFTSVQDLAAIVVKAVDLESEWPAIGGISGNRMSIREIIQVGEKVRGLFSSYDTKYSFSQIQVNPSQLIKSDSRILRMES
jgi:hypothetical protein